ncbi:MAG: circadian clock protein KaiA [Potamolinea sp.]
MPSESLTQSLSQFLSSERYILHITVSESEFFEFVDRHKQQLDCLVVQDEHSLLPVLNRLYEQGTLLPVVIFPQELVEVTSCVASNQEIETSQTLNEAEVAKLNHLFHAAEVRVNTTQLPEIRSFIEKAIAQFVSLSPAYTFPDWSTTVERQTDLTPNSFLIQQQYRLSEKLKERLGYLGVYYKRNSQLFLRNLAPKQREKLLEKLKFGYRQIVLKYFSQEDSLNQQIDSFVEQAFFADIPVSRVVEIHMELMEEFAKQLKLEGRSEEVLLDYRLTLIDVIAHLGEMYRRSIPREL